MLQGRLCFSLFPFSTRLWSGKALGNFIDLENPGGVLKTSLLYMLFNCTLSSRVKPKKL